MLSGQNLHFLLFLDVEIFVFAIKLWIKMVETITNPHSAVCDYLSFFNKDISICSTNLSLKKRSIVQLLWWLTFWTYSERKNAINAYNYFRFEPFDNLQPLDRWPLFLFFFQFSFPFLLSPTLPCLVIALDLGADFLLLPCSCVMMCVV